MKASVRTPAHLWIAGGLSALWNAFGAYDYLITQTRSQAYFARTTEAQRAYIESFPAWAEAAWACGVWGALLGSLLLLLRSRYAELAFWLSLAGLLVTTLYQYGLSDAPPEMVSGGSIGLSIVIWIIAIALLIYARRLRTKGVLR